MNTTAAPRSLPGHRRPWLPTSLGAAGLLMLLIAASFRNPAPEPAETVEPPLTSAVGPADEASTRSLREFLVANAAALEGAPPTAGKPFQRGIALGLYSQSPDYDYSGLIDEIADHGANRVSLFFNMYQDRRASTKIEPLLRAEDQEAMLARAAAHAHERGLEVTVFPLVLLKQAGTREWRGNIDPEDLGRWFESYGGHIERLARLCETQGIEGLCIGSEFSSLEQHDARWRALIARARSVYSGEIIYSANWDHYEAVPFWDAVDRIGLSGYYELTKSKEPTLEELTRAWTGIRDRILGWRARAGLAPPILFTEIGYANLDGTNIYPWDYTMKGDADPGEQALCYEAFIRAWDGQPGFSGVFFYNWFGLGTREDTGYSPRGKPAARLIRTWYADLASRGEPPQPR